MGAPNFGSRSREPTDATAGLDRAVDELSAQLMALDGAMSRLAAIAERWDRVAGQLQEHSPRLAAQARELADTIRAGCGATTRWAESPAELVARGGRLADDLRK